jgi:hypothetical protein
MMLDKPFKKSKQPFSQYPQETSFLKNIPIKEPQESKQVHSVGVNTSQEEESVIFTRPLDFYFSVESYNVWATLITHPDYNPLKNIPKESGEYEKLIHFHESFILPFIDYPVTQSVLFPICDLLNELVHSTSIQLPIVSYCLCLVDYSLSLYPKSIEFLFEKGTMISSRYHYPSWPVTKAFDYRRLY